MNTNDLVGRINSLSSKSTSDCSKKELADLVVTYSKVCKNFNDKVFRCHVLLKEAKKDEAVRLANTQPDLYHEFKYLEMIKHVEWQTLCERESLSIKEPIHFDVASEVISAIYGEDDSLDHLLKRYCRLSLERAPIEARLKVIRKLRWADSGEVGWKSDQLKFETTLLEKYASDAERAYKEDEIQILKNISKELNSGNWVKTPSQGFIKKIEETIQKLHKKNTYNKYDELSKDLNQAYDNKNEILCETILVQINQLSEETGVVPPQEVQNVHSLAKRWLGQLAEEKIKQEIIKKACLDFEEALNARSSLCKLGSMVTKIEMLGEPLPQQLAVRYKSWQEELGKQKTHRARLYRAGVFCLVIVIGIILINLSIKKAHQQAIVKWDQQISDRLNRNDFMSTRNLLENLSQNEPQIFASPEIQTLQQKYLKAIMPEIERKDKFIAALGALEKIGLENLSQDDLAKAEMLALTLGEKKQIDDWRLKMKRYVLDQRKKTEQELENERKSRFLLAISFLDQTPIENLNAKDLIKIERLSKTATEKDQVGFWQKKIEQYAKKKQEKRNQQYESELIQLEKRVISLNEICSKNRPLDEIQMNSDQCLDLASRLVSATDVSTVLIKRSKVAQNLAIKLIQVAKENAKRAERLNYLLNAISESYSQPSNMAKLLNSFIKDFPKHPLTQEFKKALKMENEWNAINAWNEMVKKYNYIFRIKDNTIPVTRSKEISNFLIWSDYPFSNLLLIYLDYLDAAKKNIDTKDIKDFDWTFDLILLSDTYVLKTKKGTILYLLSENLEEVKEGFSKYFLVKAIVNENCDLKSYKVNVNEIEEKPQFSPQKLFIQKVEELKKKDDKEKWQTFYLKVAELARTQERMDPILKAILLKTFLNSAADCNFGKCKEEINSILKLFNDVNLDVQWMNPWDSQANNIRGHISEIIAKIPSLTSLIENVDIQIQELEVSLKTCYKPVAVLMDKSGKLKISHSVTGSKDVFILKSSGSTISCEKIGILSDGFIKIESKILDTLPIGSPIYQQE